MLNWRAAAWLETLLLSSGCLTQEIRSLQEPIDMTRPGVMRWDSDLVAWEAARGAPSLFLEWNERVMHVSGSSPFLRVHVHGTAPGSEEWTRTVSAEDFLFRSFDWREGMLELGPVSPGQSVSIDVEVLEPEPGLADTVLAIHGERDGSIEVFDEYHSTWLVGSRSRSSRSSSSASPP